VIRTLFDFIVTMLLCAVIAACLSWLIEKKCEQVVYVPCHCNERVQQ
jgi:hypothetical protein